MLDHLLPGRHRADLGSMPLNSFRARTFAIAMPARTLFVASFGLLSATAVAAPLFPALSAPVREEMGEVQAQLDALPVFAVNTSPWTMGYSSAQHEDPEWPVTIEVMFPEATAVDLVVLMPSSFTDQRNRIQPWGFPLRFAIERLLVDGRSELIADYRDRDYPPPGIDPQLFACPSETPTAGLRITVTQAAPNITWWRADQVVSFSELHAFSGERNVALNSQVKASSSNEFGYMWSTKCLTDGFTLFSPLFHDVEDPENNLIGHGLEQLVLEMDLGEVHRIDEFHLWPLVHAIQHNYPPSSGIGFPLSIRLESALAADLSDAKVIHEATGLAYRPGAGPFMHRTLPERGRYLRFRLSGGFQDFIHKPPHRLDRITLSEVEILSEGRNISRGIPVRATGLSTADQQRLVSLTDGRSNEGQILPLRQWIGQFKQRVQLETRLGQLQLDLAAAQLSEQKRFQVAIGMAIGLILILLQMILLIRVAAKRRAARMRERIACDLHDEIGANVSSMAHSVELLGETIPQPSPAQSRLLSNLVDSARLTYRETKHFIRFIEAENQAQDIAEQFVQVADQILGTIPREFSLQNTRSFNGLEAAAKWNLLLFYKEVLNNIIRHSGATRVTIATRKTGRQLMLQVADNGCGFAEEVPACRRLEERAALLRGKMSIESQVDEGTTVTLHFKHHAKP